MIDTFLNLICQVVNTMRGFCVVWKREYCQFVVWQNVNMHMDGWPMDVVPDKKYQYTCLLKYSTYLNVPFETDLPFIIIIDAVVMAWELWRGQTRKLSNKDSS